MSLKKQPSDRFSDIGLYVEDEDGWWFGKGDGNHAGLQKRLAELGIVVPVRAPEDEKDNWFPAENAEFHATDTETRYTGDGKDWVEQSSSGKSPNLDSVSAESATVGSMNADSVSSSSVDADSVAGTGVLSTRHLKDGDSVVVPSGKSTVVVDLEMDRGSNLTVERGAGFKDVGGR